jgi:sugar phosphate isomerase/epimerase
MRIGVYNSCLLDWDLDRTLGWAAANGLAAVEVHAGPRYRHVDWRAVARGGPNPLVEAQSRHGVRICGLMYGALGFLAPDPRRRRAALEELEVLLRAARASEVPVVSTFTGRDPSLTLEQNLEEYARVFPRVAELAERHQVDVAFENCPMYEQWPWVHNIAVSPAIWQEQFRLVPSQRLGLNLDPSHLVWQGIDYVGAVQEFQDRIKLVQAKDTEVLDDVLRTEGMLTLRWWRHRIPGEGLIDWRSFLGALAAVGYDGTVSIEHEDPTRSGPAAVVEGVLLAKRHLEQALPSGTGR